MTDDLVNKVHEEASEKERHLHNHAIKGDMLEVGAIPLDHDQAENNPYNERSAKKKAEQDAELAQFLNEAQQAFDELMAKLDAQLDLIREAIEKLEKQMEENRELWDSKVELLDNIDDAIRGVENGCKLDRDKANSIAQSAGRNIPENATDAQILILIQDIKRQTISKVNVLDSDYQGMENSHKKFRADEQKVLDAKTKLSAIGKDSELCDNQRLQEIQKLDDTLGSKTLHAAASIVDDNKISTVVDQSLDGNAEIKQETLVHNPLASLRPN